MSDHSWRLTVEFDTNAERLAHNSYSEVFPLGDAAEFYRFVLRQWCLDPKDNNDEDVLWKDETVTLNADVLDYLAEPLRWVPMHTIPKRMELRRVDD